MIVAGGLTLVQPKRSDLWRDHQRLHPERVHVRGSECDPDERPAPHTGRGHRFSGDFHIDCVHREQFGVMVQPEDVVLENFESVNMIMNLVTSKTAQKPAG